MSSTNKTEHYNLPQFIGSDIPTWLGDFNSAMTAIDSGINAAATSASGAATTAAQALEAARSASEAANRCPFPVGYGGFFQTNPNSIYAGTTWAQKKDVFILAAGDTYPEGSTGGEANHKLTQEEIPNYKIGDIPAGCPPNHNNWDNGGVSGTSLGQASTSKKGIYNKGEQLSMISGMQFGYAVSTYGGGKPHNNMPPYFAMPFWVRTA